MKGISYYRDAIASSGVFSLSPDFVQKVLGNPKVSVEQASYSAQALEEDREATRQDEIRADYLRNNLRLVK